MNNELLDQLDAGLYKLETLVFKNFEPSRFNGISGDLDEKDCFFKTMSDGGAHDKAAADEIEKFLKLHKIAYVRKDYRKFSVKGKANIIAFTKALQTLE